jgi:hypothetical protein
VTKILENLPSGEEETTWCIQEWGREMCCNLAFFIYVYGKVSISILLKHSFNVYAKESLVI